VARTSRNAGRETVTNAAGREPARMSSSTVRYGNDGSTSLAREDSMADKNKKKTYLILIGVLLVVLLITFL
jgi:hypothetical protein